MLKKILPPTFFLLVTMVSLELSAESNYWVSSAELKNDMSFRQTLSNVDLKTTPRLLDSPEIHVNSPSLDQSKLSSPFAIEVRFKAEEGAKIDIESIRILYGWMKLDITDRIKDYATISSDGIFADSAAFPAGKHKITIEVADTQSRISLRVIKFIVNKKNANTQAIVVDALANNN